MQKKQAPEDEAKDRPTRSEQARQVVDAYDLRDIIAKLRKRLFN
jgi:hypothetical protein